MILIRSRRVITDGDVQPAGILVHDEDIIGLLPYDTVSDNCDCRVYDYGNSVVMPGVIDAHVHINEPGNTAWEGFETATRAAASGGITLLADMPLNSLPVTISEDSLNAKLKAAEGKMHTDCCFYGGLVPGSERELPGLIDAGVAGIKVFLCPSGLEAFPAVTEEVLRMQMPVLVEKGMPLLVHAELEAPAANPAAYGRSYAGYAGSRPFGWETTAIEMVLKLCRETGCHVHIVHIASAEGCRLVAEAKDEGLPVTCETAPHYLYFESSEVEDGDTRFKCAPPIRDEKNRAALRNALTEGVIDFVATDHSPSPPELKHTDTGDFAKAWGGIISLQLLLPVTWTVMKAQGAGFSDLAEWLSRRPAKLLGLDHHKGKIAPGYEGSFTIWDPESEFTVDADSLSHRHKLTPYDGRVLSGLVKSTWLRGKETFDGTTISEPKRGKPVLLQTSKEHE